jgi:hypothetical protein
MKLFFKTLTSARSVNAEKESYSLTGAAEETDRGSDPRSRCCRQFLLLNSQQKECYGCKESKALAIW